MLIYIGPKYIVEPGNVVLRPKDSGLGWHHGTGVSGGLVKDTMPGIGKRVVTLEVFADGKPVYLERPERSDFEKAVVEQRAMSDMVGGYDALINNCEHDATKAQTGVAVSPSVNFWGGVALVAGGLAVASLIGQRPQKSPRRRARRSAYRGR